VAGAIDDANATNIDARREACNNITASNAPQVLAEMKKVCLDDAARAWNSDGVPDPTAIAQAAAACKNAAK
jgi:hypothetical protein